MPFESLNYPFDIKAILQKQKTLRRSLLDQSDLTEVRLAFLGGSTTSEIKNVTELFLLKSGIKPTFHESDYNKYFEDVVVDDSELREFNPDIAYIHTTHLNLLHAPKTFDSEDTVEECLRNELSRYQAIWRRLTSDLKCMVIQNNFDMPHSRSLGGLDSTEVFGRTNFILRMNLEFARAARQNRNLVINDIHYLSSRIGIDQWFDRNYWYSYKMAASPFATVHLAHQIARMVCATLGKTRKCLVLDLDNTLWGGVIGDDGVDQIQLGMETPQGEAFTDFQHFCRELNERGILLSVCSKNEPENATLGFSHPDMVLTLDRITCFKANWETKPANIINIGKEINIGLDSLVFVDDNPAERALVSAQLPTVAVPDVGADVSRFAEFLAREGYFETAHVNRDDANRSQFYVDNKERASYESQFANYGEFLSSLEMKAEIGPFTPAYMDRISQLTNKSNQFNLTTKRYTFADIQRVAEDPSYITLYGRLADRFGDNGLVTVICGRITAQALGIELWLMSCRVLKRDMEHAMLDHLVARALERGVTKLIGYYYRTPRNAIVAEHYKKLGFDLQDINESGTASTWELQLNNDYEPRNRFLKEILCV